MKQGDPKPIIRLMSPGDSLDDLTGLLHRAYADLAKMGFRFFATHQSVDDTRDRISRAKCFVAELDGRIVGTILWFRGGKRDRPPVIYSRPETAIFGQFGVEPHLQRQGIGRMLLDQVEADARRAGCEILALDTAEGARHLIDWYEKLGFKFVEYAQWDVTNYRSVIMARSLKE